MQEQSLLEQLHSFSTQSNPAGDRLAREFLGEVGAVVADEIFGRPHTGRSITKSYLDHQQKQREISLINSLKMQHDSNVSIILNFISEISERRDKLKKPNSSSLMKKILQVQRFTKLETKIIKTIGVLQELEVSDLIYNSEIQNILSDYEYLKELENTLRRFIQNKLEKNTSNWWRERIPEDVRVNAENRKSNNEIKWPWHPASNLHPIHFVDFTDYSKVISRKDNWEQVFKPIIGGESSILATKLRELEPIRNSISHSRPLSDIESEKLKLYSSEIKKILTKC
ncbi:MAG: Swt1 family HEPN domain-containing protein [Nitrosotalea sp.]